jgi:predicted outer membrane protein
MKLLSVLCAAFMLLAAAAAATLDSTDRSYVRSAIQTELGRYALASAAAKNGSGAVKAFGKALLPQSEAQSRTLDAIAKKYGIKPPTSPSLSDSYAYGVLTGMNGRSFNQAFVTDMRTADLMQLSSERYEMRHGSNGTLKGLAKKRAAQTQHELDKLSHLK